MRSLRARLFLAILGTVLIAVGAALALGVVLTKSAVSDTIRNDVERQANDLAVQFSLLPEGAREASGAEGRNGRGAPPLAPGALGGEAPVPGKAQPLGPKPVQIVNFEKAAELLPASAMTELRAGRAADGTAEIKGVSMIYAARPVEESVVLVTRRDVVTGDDFSRYLAALLIASGVAALLAAVVAALLARRLTGPLRRLAGAAGELASGGSPEPVPRGGAEEIDELAGASTRCPSS